MAMDRDFPTDVLVEILLRLPKSSRRRARLVCRQWRDAVNKHIKETQQTRPKVLLWNTRLAIAYVSDDLSSSTGKYTELWRSPEPVRFFHSDVQLVGTTNGLLCLCNNGKGIGGAITLLNPATGETLPVPQLPCAGSFIGHSGWTRWGGAYSFTYGLATGQYKLVHVPSSYDRVYEFAAVHVLTVGDSAWREVSAGSDGGAICNLDAGIVSANGTTYWVRVTGGGAAKVVSFDLTDERVTSTAIPVPVRRDHYRLTNVHGKLGFIALPNVWVLEEEEGGRWSHRYNFGPEQGIPPRHFVYGEYILACKGMAYYKHVLEDTPPSAGGTLAASDEVVLVGHEDDGTLVARLKLSRGGSYDYYETFPYVKTVEPLSVYAKK